MPGNPPPPPRKVSKDRLQVIGVTSARRRSAADIIEYHAVLDAVIGETFDAAVLVEIDRDHPLVGRFVRYESGRGFRALGDVIKSVAAHGSDGGGRAHDNQHLFLGGADRDLLQRAFGNNIAALINLSEATTQHDAKRHNCDSRPEHRYASISMTPHFSLSFLHRRSR